MCSVEGDTQKDFKNHTKALYLLQAEAIQKLRDAVIDFHPT